MFSLSTNEWEETRTLPQVFFQVLTKPTNKINAVDVLQTQDCLKNVASEGGSFLDQCIPFSSIFFDFLWRDYRLL
jgi:hypothetical protein